MKSALECIPCMVEHSLHVAMMVTECQETRKSIIKNALARIADIDFDRSPPEMARDLHRIIRELTGVDDPYLILKDRSTEMALKLLPELREMAADNDFETIVRLVIAGNIIDYGADSHFKLSTARERIIEVMDMSIDTAAISRFERKLASARRVLYLCDNCGETVIDRLLIEPFKEKITIAVRGGAILNDATRREAEMSGLHELAEIIDSGDRSPGTVLKHCSEAFLNAFENADLIISKGQGNFETLSDTTRPICFLLRVKCPEVARNLNGVRMGSLQVITKNF